MELLKLFSLSLAFSLPLGLFIGGLFHYINLELFKLYNLKIWYSILISWLILGIIHFFAAEFFETKSFQYAFSVITILGLISIFKTNRKKTNR